MANNRISYATRDFASLRQELVNLTSYELNKLKDKLTCIEYALDLYMSEECLIISQQLRLIILELNKHITFKRHPGFYAELIGLKDKDNELFLILTNKEYLDIRKNINNFNNLNEINSNILDYYIKTDKANDFYSYINDRWLRDYEVQTEQKYIVQVDDYRIVQDKVYRELIQITENYIDNRIENKNAFTKGKIIITTVKSDRLVTKILSKDGAIEVENKNVHKRLPIKNEIITIK